MIGLISGTGLYDPMFLGDAAEERIPTEYGEVEAYIGKNFMLVLRHGKNHSIPPHKINHKANVSAFKKKGISEVIGINSVGGLRKGYFPGAIVAPHDFIQLSDVQTFFEKEVVHVTPVIDEELRKKILTCARKIKINVIPKAVYFQAPGPRLETAAEISMMSKHADIVGMTMGSEATLACELGVKYAVISSVDNYANGVVREELDFKRIMESATRRREEVKKIVAKIVEETK